jgi:hypothetical protein
MIKLHAQLESALKIRINSNDEIILALKKLAEMGKFDKPKELAIFAIILDRLGQMEDEALIEKSLKDEKTKETIDLLATTPADEPVETPAIQPAVEVPVEPVADVTPAETTPVEPAIETPTVSEFTPETVTDPTPEVTTPEST